MTDRQLMSMAKEASLKAYVPIGLRGYGNVKPIDAYKQEGFDMFEAMQLTSISAEGSVNGK